MSENKIVDITEQVYSVAQNPKNEIWQLFKGTLNGGMTCYCPFKIPVVGQGGNVQMMGCDSLCPHATCSKITIGEHEGKFAYEITCGGQPRTHICILKDDRHAANEQMPRIIR